jgi:hypothetical protein
VAVASGSRILLCYEFNLEKILARLFKTEAVLTDTVEMVKVSCNNFLIPKRVL